jgi:hypothetical protein
MHQFLRFGFRVGLGTLESLTAVFKYDLEEAVSRQYIGVGPGLRIRRFFYDVHVVLPLYLDRLLNHLTRKKGQCTRRNLLGAHCIKRFSQQPLLDSR